MRIGAPKEIKRLEFRISVTPGVVAPLVAAGHVVYVESNAGAGVGLTDQCNENAHADPVYTVDGVVHYCAANMPWAVPLTATFAPGAATAPYGMRLVEFGADQTRANDAGLAAWLNVRDDRIVHTAVADSPYEFAA